MDFSMEILAQNSSIGEPRQYLSQSTCVFYIAYDWHADCCNRMRRPPQSVSGGGTLNREKDVEELSYGADNRMAKSASISQVLPKTAADHQQ